MMSKRTMALLGATLGSATLGGVFLAAAPQQPALRGQLAYEESLWSSPGGGVIKDRNTGRVLHTVSGDTLAGADLHGINLTDTDLSRRNLSGANLEGANLTGSSLEDADLRRANLSRSLLNNAQLRNANLEGAKLIGANLWGAVLDGAHLEGANLEGANLTAARFDNYTRWPRGFDPQARGAVPVLRQQPAPGQAPADPLGRRVNLSIRDADLATAARALQDASSMIIRLEGELPQKRITLALTETPVQDILDALAALYGVNWQRRQAQIVFTGQTPPVTASGIADERLQQMQNAVNVLRQLKISGRDPLFQPDPQLTEVTRQVADLFTPEQRRQMLGAGRAEAQRYGIRVRDLPPASRQLILNWKKREDFRQKERELRVVEFALTRATAPFEEEKYLDAVLFLWSANGQSYVGLGGSRWHEGSGIPDTGRIQP